VATCPNNLAEAYDAQGRHEQAEPLFARALAISEKALGPEHPSIQIRQNHVGLLKQVRGTAEVNPPNS